MDFDDALDALGLDRGTDWPAVRAAYRAGMRVAHPDIASGDAATARRLNDAFGVLEPVFRRGRSLPPSTRPPSTQQPTTPQPAAARRPAPVHADDDPLEVALVDDDGLALVAPADEVFYRLLDALHEEGDVIYADPESNYLEALVHGGTAQLTVSLQGRAGATEAFFTLDSLRGDDVPRLETIVRSLADRLRARSGQGRDAPGAP